MSLEEKQEPGKKLASAFARTYWKLDHKIIPDTINLTATTLFLLNVLTGLPVINSFIGSVFLWGVSNMILDHVSKRRSAPTVPQLAELVNEIGYDNALRVFTETIKTRKKEPAKTRIPQQEHLQKSALRLTVQANMKDCSEGHIGMCSHRVTPGFSRWLNDSYAAAEETLTNNPKR